MFKRLKNDEAIGRAIARRAEGSQRERMSCVVSQVEAAFDVQCFIARILEPCGAKSQQGVDLRGPWRFSLQLPRRVEVLKR